MSNSFNVLNNTIQEITADKDQELIGQIENLLKSSKVVLS
jgi:hypothetical protein